MGLAYSSEYQSLKRNSAAICKRVLDRKDVQWLAQQLCGLKVISNDEKNSSLEPREKARYIVQKVERTVRQNPHKYHLLVQVLTEKEQEYRPVLEALARTYAATWRRHLLLFLTILVLLLILKTVSGYSRDFISSLHSESCYYPPLPPHTISMSLPDQLTPPPYGRDGDVLVLANSLKSKASMVNIYGAPGVGKSTLALGLAHALKDGGFTVYRADMRLACNVEEVAGQLLKAAGWYGAAQAEDLVGEVVEWAGDLDEPTLLVLDNCDDFIPKSKSAFEAIFESVARIVLCLATPQTCADMIGQEQRKERFWSLLSGLQRGPDHLRVVVTSTAHMGHALIRQGAAIGQFQVHPLDIKHSVSLLQHYIPGLNASVARKLANHVGNFPQALIAIVTSLQGNGSQNIDSVIGPMMSKLEEGDTYGFLVMTELDDSLGPPTLAYRRAYYHLTEEVRKCGRILAQTSTRVFTPRIAEYWLQSYASPDEVTRCLGMLEERDILSKLVVPSDNPSCALTVLYQFRSLYKECFTFEQKKIWYPALTELRNFKKLQEQLLEKYASTRPEEWIHTYYCT